MSTKEKVKRLGFNWGACQAAIDDETVDEQFVLCEEDDDVRGYLTRKLQAGQSCCTCAGCLSTLNIPSLSLASLLTAVVVFVSSSRNLSPDCLSFSVFLLALSVVARRESVLRRESGLRGTHVPWGRF